ncbi:MAG: hypothetical protein KF687_15935 [Cyclobacteriaceae bacterium]|nr:hypothetical protein [Cyclobacteriaceae bacterium]
MTPASRSVYYFGFYLLVLGIILIAFPNMLLPLFQFPEATEPWIRVAGMLVFHLGLYYIFMASTNNTIFLILTVYTRVAVLVWFVAFVIFGWASPMLISFGVVDATAALWTYTALRKQ